MTPHSICLVILVLIILPDLHYSRVNSRKRKDGSSIRRVESSLDELIHSNGYRSSGLFSLHVKNDLNDRIKCRRFNEETERRRLRCGHQRVNIPHSVSELFIALGILHLYRNGHLSLNDKVFGPQGVFHSVSPNNDDRIAEVTIEHLLRHTSGIEDVNFHDKKSLFDQIKLASSPGYRYTPCRMCYDLLCLVIHSTSGAQCEKYIRNHVLSPMGFTKIASKRRRTNIDQSGNAKRESWVSHPSQLVSFFRFIIESEQYSSDILSKPNLPFPQHKDKWPGLGIMVDKNGHIWSDSYRNDSDSLLLHNVLPRNNVTLLLSLAENRRKFLKPIVSSVIHKLLSEV